MSTIRFTAFLALLLGLLTACSLASEPIPAGPIERGPLPSQAINNVPVSRPRAANGAAIFQDRCASCHGPQGKGDGFMAPQVTDQGGILPNLADPDLARSRSPQEWYTIITNGNLQGLMPPWQDELSDSERWDVTYFLYSLSTPPELLEEGKAIYGDFCAECHGLTGEQAGLSDLSIMSDLSPQAIYERYVSAGTDGIHAFAEELSEQQRWAVALYAQTLGYDASLEVAEAPEVAPDQVDLPSQPVEEQAATSEAIDSSEAPVTGLTVQGRVTNGTPGSRIPEGLEVQLRGLSLDASNTVSEFLARSTTVQPDGTFRFDDLPVVADTAAYVVTAVYQGVEFGNAAMFSPEQQQIELPLVIYDPISDPSVVRVEAMHVVIREHPDALLITQLYIFGNTSDRIYVTADPVIGGRRGSVSIALPPDAYSLQFEEGQLGGRFIADGNRITDTRQVLPGQRSHSIIVTYFVPFDGSRELAFPVLYQTDQVTVLVQEGEHLRSEQLNAAGVEVIGQAAYNKYLGQALAPGDQLVFRINKPVLSRNLLTVGLAALLVLALVGGGVYGLTRRQAQPPPISGLSEEQAALARRIADLDAAFESGRINRFEYEALRADLKATLADSLQQGEHGT